MHIAEGFLPPAHAIGWTVAAAPFVVHGARAVGKEVREHPESRLLLGAAGAFTFVLSAIKLPSVTGSSSHPTGTGLGAVLFRPPIMAVLSTIVLLFQALLLAHGGITTLGANVFSMGVVGPWVGYGAYRASRAVRLPFAAGVSGSMAEFLGVFALTQIPLAIAEGLLGVVVFRLLGRVAPGELRSLGLGAAVLAPPRQAAGASGSGE